MSTRLLVPALVLVCSTQVAYAQAPVADYFSTTSQVSGTPLPAGTRIEAYDGDGVLCGSAHANADGDFLIHVNGDDPMTPDIDEGAQDGEGLAWRLAGSEVGDEDARWISNIIGAYEDLRFEQGAAKEMQLIAVGTAVEGAAWSSVKSLYQP